MFPIPTYIINLTRRTDRKTHVLNQFKDKPEFRVQIVKAIEHEIGAIGLWNTIKHIFQNLSDEKDDFVLICEDDHVFNDSYSRKTLFEAIGEALDHDADILSGGVSWLNSALKVSKNIYWVEKFTGLQFTIVFRKFVDRIIEAEFETKDVADIKISSLTSKKFFMYPFISAQREFGYSDVTPKNNLEGRVEALFNTSSESVQIINRVGEYFTQREKWITEELEAESPAEITLPTYVIRRTQCLKRSAYIKKQFLGRSEFDIRIVDASMPATNNKVSATWSSIRNIIEMAMRNEDDIIIICEDTHEFTPNYSKQFLFQNIMGAFHQGADILLGGTADFGVTVPITNNLLWLGSFSGASFLILYKPVFSKILSEDICEANSVDEILSELTSNKMVLYPFIASKNNFDDSGIKLINDSHGDLIADTFINSEKRLHTIQKAYSQYYPMVPNNMVNKV